MGDSCRPGGSSPRVRGTHRLGVEPFVNRRFIPACAGNTLGSLLDWPGIPVHPRVCGEHVRVKCRTPPTVGSSPRVRGTPRVPGLPRPHGRFIPACAGNTRMISCPETPTTVHPRVCGEHSPPATENPHDRRFIPACAGNTPSALPSHFLPSGSSPRVRGTLQAGRQFGANRRFIPACAGNTRIRSRSSRPTSVHPRVCGEHLFEILRHVGCSGSSPRVRGTLLKSRQDLRQKRFIPACAGNTRTMGRTSISTTVHPRVCGEHGKWPQSRHMVRRFIPACAGNTDRAGL